MRRLSRLPPSSEPQRAPRDSSHRADQCTVTRDRRSSSGAERGRATSAEPGGGGCGPNRLPGRGWPGPAPLVAGTAPPRDRAPRDRAPPGPPFPRSRASAPETVSTGAHTSPATPTRAVGGTTIRACDSGALDIILPQRASSRTDRGALRRSRGWATGANRSNVLVQGTRRRADGMCSAPEVNRASGPHPPSLVPAWRLTLEVRDDLMRVLLPAFRAGRRLLLQAVVLVHRHRDLKALTARRALEFVHSHVSPLLSRYLVLLHPPSVNTRASGWSRVWRGGQGYRDPQRQSCCADPRFPSKWVRQSARAVSASFSCGTCP